MAAMALHCALSVAKTDSGYVIRVKGNGTSAESPTLADFVSQCFNLQPQADVAIDLLGCDYLDSTFLGCLLNLQRADKNSRFQVVADSAAQQRLLAATRLNSYLTLVTEAPKSADKFVGLDPKSMSDRDRGQHIMETHQALSELPSDAASSFARIAEQLKRELDQQDRGDVSLDDTVVPSVPPRK
jgi:anti-anti-sigma factor